MGRAEGVSQGAEASLSIQRALGYLEHDRLADARTELIAAMRESPEDPYPVSLYSMVCGSLGDPSEAVKAAQQAIGLDPEFSLAHHALAQALFHIDQHQRALEPVREAIRLNPENESHFLLLGSIHLARRSWKEALEAAERALALDPESADALNQKSFALQMLGRKAEAIEASLQSLSHEPDSSTGVAGHGLALLRAGRQKEAEAAFRDALKLDPESEFARQGLLQSLRVRFLPYRLVFAFHSWQEKFSSLVRWSLWLGLYYGARAARWAARSYPSFAPVLLAIAACYSVFVALTWCSLVLANVTLLFHPLGKFALAKVEKAEAWVAASAIVTAAAGGVLWLAGVQGGAVAGLGALLVIFITGLGSHISQTAWLRWTFSVGLGGLALAGMIVLGVLYQV